MTMQYVVIDTNVIVSALLAQDHRHSVPFAILEAVFLGKITPVLSKDIMTEYVSVLNRDKFGFDKEWVKVILAELTNQAVMVSPSKTPKELPDPKDVCFYDAAAVYEDSGVFLVTGNMKHFPDCPFAVTPSQLKEKLNL
jgi:putative PIN family toxin of toxin-antitoxin system